MKRKICDLRGYENVKGFYYVDDLGNFYSYNGRKDQGLMKQYRKTGGYLYVTLMQNDGTTICKRSHRIVASAFVPNPDNKPTVEHINGIRDDNNITNLTWFTHKEQNIKFTKEVWIYDLKLNFIMKVKSVKDCKQYGFNPGHVSAVCRNVEKSHKGHIFSYKKFV